MSTFGGQNRINVLGFEHLETGLKNQKNKGGVYLDSQPPTPLQNRPKDAFGKPQPSTIETIYSAMTPMITLLKVMGMLPMTRKGMGNYR